MLQLSFVAPLISPRLFFCCKRSGFTSITFFFFFPPGVQLPQIYADSLCPPTSPLFYPT
jgi:hypothetical protein